MEDNIKNSADWWNEVVGPVALNLQDNPVLALDIAKMGASRTDTLAFASSLNEQGGEQDYNDEQQVGNLSG